MLGCTDDVMGSVVTGSRKHAGLIRKYGLNMSRQAFREKAAEIGFVKVCEISVLDLVLDLRVSLTGI